MDVKSTFLNGVLNEEAYAEQLAGFVRSVQDNKMYRLKRVLYGLKKPQERGIQEFIYIFLTRDFQRCPYEYTLYIKFSINVNIFFVSQYVDDLFFTGYNPMMLADFRLTDRKRVAYGKLVVLGALVLFK